VPKGSGEQIMASLQMIPAEHRTSWRIHRVAPGETVASIVKQFGLPVASLMAANRLEKPEAAEGDRLIIPTGARTGSAEKPQAAARRPAAVRRTASASAPKSRKKHAKGGLVERTAAQ
jgi:LysM repeat protein